MKRIAATVLFGVLLSLLAVASAQDRLHVIFLGELEENGKNEQNLEDEVKDAVCEVLFTSFGLPVPRCRAINFSDPDPDVESFPLNRFRGTPVTLASTDVGNVFVVGGETVGSDEFQAWFQHRVDSFADSRLTEVLNNKMWLGAGTEVPGYDEAEDPGNAETGVPGNVVRALREIEHLSATQDERAALVILEKESQVGIAILQFPVDANGDVGLELELAPVNGDGEYCTSNGC